MASALQLINSDIDPRGRRYTPEDREHAYITWRVVGRRSLTKTSELTGIAENTLRAWFRHDEWKYRSDREDGDAAELARQSLATLATNEVVKSLEVVTQLRDDPSTPAKTRLDAAIFVLGLWGVAPTKNGETSIQPPLIPERGQRIPTELINSLDSQQLSFAERAIRNGEWSAFYACLTENQLVLAELSILD